MNHRLTSSWIRVYSSRMDSHDLSISLRARPIRHLLPVLLGVVSVLAPVAALAASLTPLGDLPGGEFQSTATALSADGKVIVGWSTSTNGQEAFRWTAAGGMAGLGDLPGGAFSSAAYGVSADGKTVVGSGNGPDLLNTGIRWTETGGLQALDGFPNYNSAAGVSADGGTVVGGGSEVWIRWTKGNSPPWLERSGYVLEPAPFGAITADGSVIVGRFGASQDPFAVAEASRAVFTNGTTMTTRLGLLAGYPHSTARAVSADGSIVVGNASYYARGYFFGGEYSGPAFRWTEASGMVPLPGGASSAHGVTADGRTVVGWSYFGAVKEAVVWPATGGVKSLKEILVAQGVDLAAAGWTALTEARAISPDGRYVVGTGTRKGRTEAFLAEITIPRVPVEPPPPVVMMDATLTPLGDLPGRDFYSTAAGISADGKTVVGTSQATNGNMAFRWTASGGMTALGDLFGLGSHAAAISADAKTIVGWCDTKKTDYPYKKGFRWTSETGMMAISGAGRYPDFLSGDSVSADGSTIVGQMRVPLDLHLAIVPGRWTFAEGVIDEKVYFGSVPRTDLLGFNNSDVTASGVSADGKIIVGSGFRWTADAGRVSLTNLNALGISADGSTVVGWGSSTNGRQAFVWTTAGGMVGLGDLPGGSFSSQANAASADGSVIVGFGYSADEKPLFGKEAFVWTAATGMRSLNDVLVARGGNPGRFGWTSLTEATAVSADGRYVAGTGIHNGNTEAFLADLKAVIEPTSEVTTTVSGGAVTLYWNANFRTAPTVHRATKPEGPYTAVPTGPLLGSYTETPPDGAPRFFRVVWP